MQQDPKKLSMAQVLMCGAAIVTLSMGIRHGFGLWLQPITQDMGWTRQSFALAIAIQNLAWGCFGIFAGMAADRFGAFRVLIGGAVLYGLGLVGMALSPTPTLFALTAGVLIGAAQAGTTYAVIYGVLGRQIAPEKRSWAMGVAAAAGSFGQFLMVPVEGQLIVRLGWQEALLVLSAFVLLIVPLAFGLREPGFQGRAAGQRSQTVVQAMGEALRYPSFLMLTAGYFVCGFQVVFIGVHMPSYLKDHGMSPQVASYALALIGLFNVFGTYIAGTLGQRNPKRYILAFIYFARAVVITIFLLVPLTPMSVYVFSAVMGALWLSTVPPTNATVAQIFGVQHLSMLGGFVFFSHQIGSFLGVWLGGYLYDTTGSYDVVWYLSIGLGVLAGLVNLPVKEGPIHRAPQPA
ncbi:MFS transporter [Paracidovorax valerianellae]|uniref:Predicted arabinose efflux permease, MFS family n=1 Tax=Paracidovorax valerianellae TaxID=187868 RepID=A0A1G6WVX7_9BURK|nr:MFS transporter [Paracidovorax valerianellae]MDA8447644.1 MFS transporter [Paracidovorax valerianellae]SDD69175.1 Predicted arabinose efflux permease, MFS family [Paracidovorax valerianellae]